jgi:hypothetical protein
MKRRKRLRGKSWNMPERFVPDPAIPPTSDKVDYVQEKKRLVDEIIGEDKHVLAEIARKFQSSAPICNKGAYMYIGASDDLTAIGRKK